MEIKNQYHHKYVHSKGKTFQAAVLQRNCTFHSQFHITKKHIYVWKKKMTQ